MKSKQFGNEHVLVFEPGEKEQQGVFSPTAGLGDVWSCSGSGQRHAY